MRIKINGQIENVEANLTVRDLLLNKSLNPENVVVEYNLNIVQSDKWSKIILKETDSLEVLNIVKGG